MKLERKYCYVDSIKQTKKEGDSDDWNLKKYETKNHKLPRYQYARLT